MDESFVRTIVSVSKKYRPIRGKVGIGDGESMILCRDKAATRGRVNARKIVTTVTISLKGRNVAFHLILFTSFCKRLFQLLVREADALNISQTLVFYGPQGELVFSVGSGDF